MSFDEVFLHTNMNPMLCGIISPTINENEANFHLLGIPLDSTSSYRTGAKLGPDHIRYLLSSDNFECTGELGVELSEHYKIKDWGNLALRQGRVVESYELIRKVMNNLLRSTQNFLVFGGDHGIEIPVHEALDQNTQEFAILYFDAHFDAYQELCGEPLSHGSTLFKTANLENFAPEKSAVIGIRDFPREHKKWAEDIGLKVIYAHEFAENPPSALAQLIISQIKRLKENSHLHVCIDLDVFDPSAAPAVGNPTAGGLTSRQVFSLLSAIGKGMQTHPFDSCSITEYNPAYDNANITGFLIIKLVIELLSSRIW